MSRKRASRVPVAPRSAALAGSPVDLGATGLAPAIMAIVVMLGVTLGARGDDLLPSPGRMLVVLAAPLVALLVAYTRRNAIVVGYLILAGIALRWVDFFPGGGSDVLNSVTEAIGVFIDGGNPYHHYYETTRPPGQLMPYPPFQLILHFPGWLLGGYDGVRLTELAAATGSMLLLGLVARRSPLAGLVGLALYASLPNLINLTGDGGNDTSAGFMILLAIVTSTAAVRRSMTGRSAVVAGVAVALAVATKQSTLLYAGCLAAFVFFAFRPAFARFAAGGAGALLVCALPFLAPDPTYLLHGITTLSGHDIEIYGWNASVLLSQLGLPVPGGHAATVFDTLAVAIAAALSLPLVRRGIGHAALAGTAVTLIALLAAQWTSYSYFALLLAPACALPALLELDLDRRWNRRPSTASAAGEGER